MKKIQSKGLGLKLQEKCFYKHLIIKEMLKYNICHVVIDSNCKGFIHLKIFYSFEDVIEKFKKDSDIYIAYYEKITHNVEDKEGLFLMLNFIRSNDSKNIIIKILQ